MIKEIEGPVKYTPETSSRPTAKKGYCSAENQYLYPYTLADKDGKFFVSATWSRFIKPNNHVKLRRIDFSEAGHLDYKLQAQKDKLEAYKAELDLEKAKRDLDKQIYHIGRLREQPNSLRGRFLESGEGNDRTQQSPRAIIIHRIKEFYFYDQRLKYIQLSRRPRSFNIKG